ncbi:activity-regulated cytoskeleton-associated protein isoform X1 [Rhizophagus clarus]|uniref:Activity-regulated cytoskeleton-associated protein isoform X1 n=1 Tax=Rhizophagus clarus TaxID=94130 RepID=A0A8H3M0K1_9GLOM|nr:activity-regulated cytoskeleton-associated protein isoform X1 [Rhizophagus clarus]
MIEPYTTQQLFDQPADITVGQLLAMNPKLRMAVNKNLRKSIVKKKDETTKKRTTVNEKKGENEATEIEDLMAINISKPSNDKSSTLYCEASIKHIKFLLIVDSGSARSIMSLVLLKDLQMEITRASKTVMVNVNGKQRRPLGAVSAIPLNIMGQIIPMDAIVTDADSYAAIVGNDWLRKTKANIDYGTNKLTLKWEDEILRIPTELEEEADEAIEESEEEYETDNDEKQQEQLYCNTQFITRERAQEIEQDLKENKLIENECYYQYKEEFMNRHVNLFAWEPDDFGRTSVVKYGIDTGNAVPVKQRFYQTSYKNQLSKEEIQRLLKAELIVPSRSQWTSPVVVVKKKMERSACALTTGS